MECTRPFVRLTAGHAPLTASLPQPQIRRCSSFRNGIGQRHKAESARPSGAPDGNLCGWGGTIRERRHFAAFRGSAQFLKLLCEGEKHHCNHAVHGKSDNRIQRRDYFFLPAR